MTCGVTFTVRCQGISAGRRVESLLERVLFKGDKENKLSSSAAYVVSEHETRECLPPLCHHKESS